MNDTYMGIQIRIGHCFVFAAFTRKPHFIMLYLFLAFQGYRELAVYSQISQNTDFSSCFVLMRLEFSLNLESHRRHSVLSLSDFFQHVAVECAQFVKNSRIGHIEDRIYKNIPITFAASLKTTLASRELCSQMLCSNVSFYVTSMKSVVVTKITWKSDS